MIEQATIQVPAGTETDPMDLLATSDIGGEGWSYVGSRESQWTGIDGTTRDLITHCFERTLPDDWTQMQCVDCGKRTTYVEADTRVFNTGRCGDCNGELEVVS